MQVLQLRYGALDASTAQRLAVAAQTWAQQVLATPLGLAAPPAAAAASARKQLAVMDAAAATAATASDTAAGPDQQQQSSSSSSSAGQRMSMPQTAGRQLQDKEEEHDESQWEEQAEDDDLAQVLELQADDVLDVNDELLTQLREGVNGGGSESQGGGPPADAVLPPPRRSQEQVLQELQLYSGYRASTLTQQQLQQLQRAAQGTALGPPEAATTPNPVTRSSAINSRESQRSGRDAVTSAREQQLGPQLEQELDEVEIVSDEPSGMLASWLAGRPVSSEEEVPTAEG